jgi:hypothetical protein
LILKHYQNRRTEDFLILQIFRKQKPKVNSQNFQKNQRVGGSLTPEIFKKPKLEVINKNQLNDANTANSLSKVPK